ncbi:MAG TPA: hypothetical protein VF026_23130 [Ktedonobacteraceae bacterium]
MKTREVGFEPVDPQQPAGRKKRSWLSLLSGVGAVLVVILVVGASAFVFAQLSQHRQAGGRAGNPAAGKWTQVLSGYSVSSVVAADNAPAVLYACAWRVQPDTLSPGQSGTGIATYTLLKSTDDGTHWQDVGSKANLGGNCQVAVNPADSNELFATGEGVSNGQATGILKHSTDGGKTWTTIQPQLNVPGTQSAQVWNVQQLSMVGGRLFGLQMLARHLPPVVFQGTPPRSALALAQLVMSSDGGHSWNVLDNQFANTRQEARAYAVDPANPSTIYELVGLSWLPLRPGAAEPNDVIPPAGPGGDLYKTTDNGASWHLILQGLPFGARVHVQLAGGGTQVIYAGGAISPMPYVAGAPEGKVKSVGGSFELQVSRDGGASWRNVPAAPGQAYVQNWIADAHGNVFAGALDLKTGTPGGQPTAVTGTVVAVTPVRVPAGTPQSRIPVSGGDVSVANEQTTVQPGAVPAFSTLIERYDLAANTWSVVTNPPASGELLALTPGGASGDTLWYMGMNKGEAALYRFVM